MVIALLRFGRCVPTPTRAVRKPPEALRLSYLGCPFTFLYLSHISSCVHTPIKFTILKCPSQWVFFFFSVYLQCCVTSPLSNSIAFLSPPRKLPLCKVVNSIPSPSSSWQLLLYFSDAANLPIMDSSYK